MYNEVNVPACPTVHVRTVCTQLKTHAMARYSLCFVYEWTQDMNISIVVIALIILATRHHDRYFLSLPNFHLSPQSHTLLSAA